MHERLDFNKAYQNNNWYCFTNNIYGRVEQWPFALMVSGMALPCWTRVWRQTPVNYARFCTGWFCVRMSNQAVAEQQNIEWDTKHAETINRNDKWRVQPGIYWIWCCTGSDERRPCDASKLQRSILTLHQNAHWGPKGITLKQSAPATRTRLSLVYRFKMKWLPWSDKKVMLTYMTNDIYHAQRNTEYSAGHLGKSRAFDNVAGHRSSLVALSATCDGSVWFMMRIAGTSRLLRTIDMNVTKFTVCD